MRAYTQFLHDCVIVEVFGNLHWLRPTDHSLFRKLLIRTFAFRISQITQLQFDRH